MCIHAPVSEFSVLRAQYSDFRFARVSSLTRSYAVRSVIFRRSGAELGERIAGRCHEMSAPIGARKGFPLRNSQFLSAPLRFESLRANSHCIVLVETEN